MCVRADVTPQFGVMGKAATDGSRFQSEFQVVLEKIQVACVAACALDPRMLC